MKKVFLALMTVAVIALAGCKGSQNEPTPEPTKILPKDMVGRGYDATQQYARELYVAAPVLSQEKLRSAGLMADVTQPFEASQTIIYGSSLEEYHKNLSNQFGLELSLFGFTASLKSNFSLNKAEKMTYSYLTGRYCYKKYIYKIIKSPIDDLMPCLSDNFLNDVDRLSAKDLVLRYGTHVINGLSVGGVVEMHTTAKRTEYETEQEFSAALKAGFKGAFSISGSDEFKLYKQFKSLHAECEEKLVCRGGDSHLIPVATVDSVNASVLKTWCESITDESKSVLIDFEGIDNVPDSKLIPLYEFIRDETKKAEVKAYIENRMENPWNDIESNVLIVYLRKIKLHYNMIQTHNWHKFTASVSVPKSQTDILFDTWSNDHSVQGGGLNGNYLHFLRTDDKQVRVLDFCDKSTISEMAEDEDKAKHYFDWGEPKTIPYYIPLNDRAEFTIKIDQLKSWHDYATPDNNVLTLSKAAQSEKWTYMGNDKREHSLVDRDKAQNDDERFVAWRFYSKKYPDDMWIEFYFEIDFKKTKK